MRTIDRGFSRIKSDFYNVRAFEKISVNNKCT